MRAQIYQQSSNIGQTGRTVVEAQAALDFSKLENARYQDLLEKGAGTKQLAVQSASDLDSKLAGLSSPQFGQSEAERQLLVLDAQRKNAEAQLTATKAQKATADANLSRTELRATTAASPGSPPYRANSPRRATLMPHGKKAASKTPTDAYAERPVVTSPPSIWRRRYSGRFRQEDETSRPKERPTRVERIGCLPLGKLIR